MYKIMARKWFQTSFGNTYHSCVVIKTSGKGKTYKEKEIGKVNFTYGYGESWKQTTHEIMVEAGEFKGDYMDWLGYVDDNPEQFVMIVEKVNRKRDLWFL